MQHDYLVFRSVTEFEVQEINKERDPNQCE